MTRPWPIAGFLLSLLLGFLLVTGVILTAFAVFTQWQTQRFQDQAEQAIFQSIQSELQASYRFLDDGLIEEKQRFLRLHEAVLKKTGGAIRGEDLPELQQWLEKKAGVPVDLYLINPDMKVTHTTYEPDQGLDFNHPGLFDARHMIERTRKSGKTLVSPPVMEAAAREFRIYTYSPLDDNGTILELGFVPPDLNRYFKNLSQRMKERELFDARLFFLMWDEWLLSMIPPEKNVTKHDQMNHSLEQKQPELPLFRQARDSEEPVRVYRSGRMTHYLHLTDIPTDGNWEVNVMARITMNSNAVTDTRQGLMVAIAAIMALMVVSAVTVYFLLRQTLAVPLTEASRAMEQGERFPLTGAGRRIRELRLLAAHYNRLLGRTRSKIRGLDKAVRTDPLTQIANRAQLDNELDLEIKRCERYGSPLGLIFLDIDHFKDLNDTQGHLEGDRILCALAEILSERIRDADTVGRWGGEEFLILCRNSHQGDAMNLAEMLRATIEEARLNGQPPVTASFGVAGYRQGDTLASLVDRADQALYQAKLAGRNRVVWV
ncbi:MAG: GGDEF domain-containing protein [Oleiphilaceae bacterium]|nr:GGDEF domain-containing protein [Oleiphilaceae bacterium]